MNLNEPAMPTIGSESLGATLRLVYSKGGFTKQELAAIHLCVPMSGNDELDALLADDAAHER